MSEESIKQVIKDLENAYDALNYKLGATLENERNALLVLLIERLDKIVGALDSLRPYSRHGGLL